MTNLLGLHGVETMRKSVNSEDRPLYGEERRETSEQKAERVVGEELKRHGLNESEMTLKRKGHPVKIAAAKRLRKETTMTLKRIAERLQMGSLTHVFNLLASEKERKNG